jgi:inorganic pyrophosphatase
VLEEDYQTIKNIDDLSDEKKKEISSFFDNYKKNVNGKWSKIGEFINKNDAIKLYNRYRL